mgnify:CR=1 FL=1
MNKILSLSLRNLSRQKRRNAILAVAIAFGFFVVTAIDGLTTGMVGNLEDQITQLTGGTVLMQGLEWNPAESENGKPYVTAIVRDKDYIRNIVETNNIDYKYFSCYSMSSGQYIFNRKQSISQIYGRDFNDEHLVDSFKFASGGIELTRRNPNGVIISNKTAESMNIQVGDDLIFTTTTIHGQNTVTDLTVTGIIESNSFMNSMQAYCDIETLNKLIGIPEGGYSTFTIFLNNKNDQTKVANLLESKMRSYGVSVTSRLEAMKTNPNNIGKGIEKQIEPKTHQWEGTMYAVETLYDEVPAIKSVLSIVHIVTTVILVVILLIVMVGVSNTYRMVLYERIREIGTMRALGMSGKDTGKVFTYEAAILCVLGALAGLIFAVIVMSVIHLIPVSNESLSFFLNNGHFSFKLSTGSIIIQYILLIVLTTFAVKGSAKTAAKMSPAEALRTVK